MLKDLKDSITSFGIDAEHVALFKHALVEEIVPHGHKKTDAKCLVDGWTHEGDFLLAGLSPVFDCIVGNPPYIHNEPIAPELQAEYRRGPSSPD